MADENKKFTVKSDKVLGERPKEKDIVVDVPNTFLKGQSSTPSISANFKQPKISTNVSYGDVSTKKHNINLEIDLKGLGEERQPDGTRFIYKPEVSTVDDLVANTVGKPFKEQSLLSDTISLEYNLFKDHVSGVTSFDSKIVDTLKEDSYIVTEFITQSIEKPFSDTYGVSDFNEILISPSKEDVYFVEDESFRNFEKFLSDKVTATDDAFGNLNPDDDQVAGLTSPEFDTTGILDEDSKVIIKGEVDITSLIDLQYFGYEKIKQEYLLLADVKEVEFSKVFEESFSLSDSIEQELNKSLLELFVVSDSDTKLIEPGKLETLTTPDTVENVFYKSIVDLITATDDAFGNLNPDDDQVAGTNKPADDSSGVADVDYRIITKAIFDTVHAISDLEIKDDSIKDISQIQDLLSTSLSKQLEDSFGNSDEVQLHTTPSKQDIATLNDILTTVVQFLYNIDNTATTTSSGNINRQDYFAEEFTNDDYTGENFSF